MTPMTRAFVEALEDFARSAGLDVVSFEEGVLFLGKAQEKAPVFRTERRTNPKTGASYAWLYRSTAMVNQYYFYAIDRERRILRKGANVTPGRFRTRVITEGVYPSLHVDYKATRIKQYHKEGRALRTETTINNTWDLDIGKRLHNLPALREVGFRANRRLLDIQRVSHDCSIGEQGFHAVQRPRVVDGQRAPALRFGDERVHALLPNSRHET